MIETGTRNMVARTTVQRLVTPCKEDTLPRTATNTTAATAKISESLPIQARSHDEANPISITQNSLNAANHHTTDTQESDTLLTTPVVNNRQPQGRMLTEAEYYRESRSPPHPPHPHDAFLEENYGKPRPPQPPPPPPQGRMLTEAESYRESRSPPHPPHPHDAFLEEYYGKPRPPHPSTLAPRQRPPRNSLPL